MSLENKVAIITGASSGIGAGTAALFSRLGASLVITGRNEKALDETIENCDPEARNKIVKVVGDITKDDVQKSIVNEAISKFSKINILINNAGVFQLNCYIENLKIDSYEEIMNINVTSVIKLTQLCLPHLIETKGTIVNLSSIAGSRTFPNMLAYGISKAALDQFTKSVALELAPKGVRVNSVNPGVIVTGIHVKAGMSEEQYAKFLDHCKTTHPLGRPGTVDEVAKAIAFLASDESSFTTGEIIHIDGGRHAMCPR